LRGQSFIEVERIAEAFDRLDSDGNGQISRANLINFLGKDETASGGMGHIQGWQE
jgi:Ca2+-binding EF-hand superfamily protein